MASGVVEGWRGSKKGGWERQRRWEGRGRGATGEGERECDPTCVGVAMEEAQVESTGVTDAREEWVEEGGFGAT